MSFVRDVLLPYPPEVIERALDLATAQYTREGLTSVTDAGVAGGWIGHAPSELAAYQNAREHAVLRTRMQVMPVIDALTSIPGAVIRLRSGLGRRNWPTRPGQTSANARQSRKLIVADQHAEPQKYRGEAPGHDHGITSAARFRFGFSPVSIQANSLRSGNLSWSEKPKMQRYRFSQLAGNRG
jgi:hypothetical protein